MKLLYATKKALTIPATKNTVVHADIPKRSEMKVLGIPYTVYQSTWRKCHRCNEEWKIMEHDRRNCRVFETTSELAKLLAFSLALSLLSTRSSNTSANASGDCRWLPVTAESSGDRASPNPPSPCPTPADLDEAPESSIHARYLPANPHASFVCPKLAFSLHSARTETWGGQFFWNMAGSSYHSHEKNKPKLNIYIYINMKQTIQKP